MRLATARDEIEPLRDPAVRQNEAYLSVLLLARVVTRIGDLTEITPAVIEGLYAADFDHLQRLYERLNTDGEPSAGRRARPADRVRGRPHRDRGRAPGGMTRPSPRQLFAETAELADHFHWPLDTILDLEHRDRRRFLELAQAFEWARMDGGG